MVDILTFTTVDNGVDKLYASVLEVVKHIRETS